MNHDVVDVADRLTSLYTTVDVPSLTYIVTHVLPSFECQWKDMMAVIDIAGLDSCWTSISKHLVESCFV